MAATANTTFARGLPCTARGDPPISSLHFKRSKLLVEFLLVLNRVSLLSGFQQAALRIQYRPPPWRASGIGAQPLSRPSGGLSLCVDVEVFGLGVGTMQT